MYKKLDGMSLVSPRAKNFFHLAYTYICILIYVNKLIGKKG